jgi:hypothetical protein
MEMISIIALTICAIVIGISIRIYKEGPKVKKNIK